MLQRIWSPAHQDHVIVGGRIAPKQRSKIQIGDYLKKGVKDAPLISLPTAPDTLLTLGTAATPILRNIFKNNAWGCCVPAGSLHVQGVTSGNGSGLITAGDAEVTALYKQMCPGFDPANPATDTGCDEQFAFKTLMTQGFPNGEKLVGFAGVDGTNPVLVRQVMYAFENVVFGVGLPDAWISPFPSNDGYVWHSGTPNANNGHCYIAWGYQPGRVSIDSWALYGDETDEAVAGTTTSAAGGELYVLFLSDSI